MKLGDTLDKLGVEAILDDADLVTSAVVILSVFEDGDSRPRLVVAQSENLSWIERAGLLAIAKDICVNETASQLEDDEDE